MNRFVLAEVSCYRYIANRWVLVQNICDEHDRHLRWLDDAEIAYTVGYEEECEFADPDEWRANNARYQERHGCEFSLCSCHHVVVVTISIPDDSDAILFRMRFPSLPVWRGQSCEHAHN